MEQKTLKQMAEEVKEVKTMNIADAGVIPVSINIEVKEFTKTDGEVFTINVATIGDLQYRVPQSVLTQLKALMLDDETITHVKVLKNGEGISTQYTVVPKGE